MTTAPAAALLALLDQAMADAACGRSGAGGSACEAVDLHLSLLHRAAGPLTAHAAVTGGGRSICFCEAHATDAAGRTVAQAMGTYRLNTPRTPDPQEITR